MIIFKAGDWFIYVGRLTRSSGIDGPRVIPNSRYKITKVDEDGDYVLFIDERGVINGTWIENCKPVFMSQVHILDILSSL